jgi:hypothetical protein
MQAVINRWKGDPHKSEDAHKLASDKESKDLKKLEQKVVDGVKSGLKHAQIIFRGSTRTLTPKQGQTGGDALRQELSTFWRELYPKYEKVPVVIASNEQKDIIDVLNGSKNLPADVRELKLFDKSGQVDVHGAMLDEIGIFLSMNKNKARIRGKDLIDKFEKPEYGWAPSAVRIGTAALVRAGAIKVIVDKKVYTNPADSVLQDHLRNGKLFDKTELEYEELDVSPEILEAVRGLLIRLTGKRKIEETPSALSIEIETYGKELLRKADMVSRWAEPAELPLPKDFIEGKETYEKLLALTNPKHRVNEIYSNVDKLEAYTNVIRIASDFVDKWGKAYRDMSKFATSLSALEHLLNDDGKCNAFLNNWEAAKKNSSIINESDWNKLQDSKASASIEMDKYICDWQKNASETIEKALKDIPERLSSLGIPLDKENDLKEPLLTFLDGIDKVDDVTRIAALPLTADKLIQTLDNRIESEYKKLHAKPGEVKDNKPIRKVKIIRAIIESEDQWKQRRDALDQEVIQELKSGNRVELV